MIDGDSDNSDELNPFGEIEEEITLVDDIPTCPRCKSVLGDTSKFGDELQTLKCTNDSCGYGRVRVRPTTI